MRVSWIFVLTAPILACQPSEQPAEEEEARAETVEPATMDAPAVDPDHYEVELENDYVRVIRLRYQAGEESPMHSHADGVIIYLTDGAATIHPEGGETQQASWEAGDAIWAPAETHGGTAESDFEAVLVEIKAPPEDVEITESNATEVDPDHHEVEFENDRVRLVRMIYPAGYTTPPHTHLPGVNVILTDYQATSTPEGGEPESGGGEAGEVSWVEAGPPHVTENTGDEAFSLVRVEVKAAS